MALLQSTERHLEKDPELSGVYNREIHKLEQAGYTVKQFCTHSMLINSCGPYPQQAQVKQLLDNIRQLATGGFEIRKRASNFQVIPYLPTGARSEG